MDLVVKDNALVNASYTLSLVEQRLILLAIVEARETGQGIDTESFLEVHAQHYANRFNIQLNNAYAILAEATDTLFHRQVTYMTTDEKRNKPEKRVVRWVSGISYVEGSGIVKLRFAPEVVPLITRLEKNFTSYELEQVKHLNSYAIRLYEILISWKSVGKVTLNLEELRQKLGLVNEYKAMSDFKKRVLDISLVQINENTNITASYDQHKQGRIIIGFTFKLKVKDKPKADKDKPALLDVNTADMFTTDGLSDAQLARIARNPVFIADYNHLVSPQSPAGQGGEAWVSEMIKRLKLEPKQFSKKPIREYLEY